MSTLKGMKCVPRTLATGDKVLIYNDAEHIVVQLRHQVPTEEQLLEPYFKVAVSLNPAEAIAIASDLLNAALPQLAFLRASFPMSGVDIAAAAETRDAEVVDERISSEER